MKILFCTSFFENTHNGAGQFANTVCQINKLFPEHELRILSEDITNPNAHHYAISINYPRWLQAFGMLLRSFSYYRAAKKIQRDYDYDILFFNNAFTGLWSALWMSKSIKVIGFIHDDNYLSYHLGNFTLSKKWFVRYFYRQLERLSTKWLQVVFTNTNYLRNEILKGYKAKPTKVLQVYVPVDIQSISFQPDRSFGPQQVIKILFVKNDFIRGGLEDLVAALGQLSYQFLLSIIGPFPRAANQIQQLVQKHPNIQLDFRANCNQEEVFAAMQTHHILSIPARKEGQGVANIEGLAHGISVISTRVGGIPEVMNQGDNGWLVEANAPTQLAAAIQDCIQNSVQRKLKSEKGNIYIKHHFDTKSILAKIVARLEQV